MRWLLLPHVGVNDPRTDSNFLLFCDLARTLVDAGDFVYLTGPWVPGREGLPELARTQYAQVPGSFDYYTNHAAVDLEWLVRSFSRRWGSYVIDGVVTSKIALVPTLQAILSDGLRCHDVPVYGIEPAVYGNGIGPSFKGHSAMAMRAVGYAVGIPVLLSDHEVLLAERVARKFLNGATVARIQERAIVMPPGLDFDALDRVRTSVERPPAHERFKLFSGARINAAKRSARIADLYDRLWQAGLATHITVVSPTAEGIARTHWGEGGEALATRPEIEVVFRCPRDQYLRYAAASHAFVVWSESEGVPVGFIEQIYLGAIGLFPRAEWARACLPPDYPWFFSGEADAVRLLQQVARDYPSACEWTDRNRAWIRARYAKQVTWTRLRDDLEKRLAGGGHSRTTSGMAELVDAAMAVLPRPFSLVQLLRTIGRVSRSFKPTLQQKRWWKEPTNFDMHRFILEDRQHVDTCEAALPMYRPA